MKKQISTKKALVSFWGSFTIGLYMGAGLPIDEKWSIPIMCVAACIAVAGMFVKDEQ